MTSSEKEVKLPRLQVGPLVLDAVVVVGKVNVGDGTDLGLATLLIAEPWPLEANHVGPVVLVEPGPAKNQS